MPIIPQNPNAMDTTDAGTNVTSNNYDVKKVAIYSIAIIVGSLAVVAVGVVIARRFKRKREERAGRPPSTLIFRSTHHKDSLWDELVKYITGRDLIDDKNLHFGLLPPAQRHQLETFAHRMASHHHLMARSENSTILTHKVVIFGILGLMAAAVVAFFVAWVAGKCRKKVVYEN
ncbi:MAG: hypothetical protein Q9218_006405 [Villophora microphyllina]